MGDQPLVVIGGAIHYENGETGTGVSTETENLRWTVDGRVGGGWSVFAAVVGCHPETSAGVSTDRLAAMIQGGIFVTENLEIVGRYEWGDSDTAGEEDLSLVTVGFNYFVKKHQLKFSTDVGYAFNAVSDSWDSTSLGWRKDSAGENGQIVVRSQVQLLF